MPKPPTRDPARSAPAPKNRFIKRQHANDYGDKLHSKTFGSRQVMTIIKPTEQPEPGTRPQHQPIRDFCYTGKGKNTCHQHNQKRCHCKSATARGRNGVTGTVVGHIKDCLAPQIVQHHPCQQHGADQKDACKGRKSCKSHRWIALVPVPVRLIRLD